MAWAAADAGHSVAVTGQPALMPLVTQAGFEALSSGTWPPDSGERPPLSRVDLKREDRDFSNGFAGRTALDPRRRYGRSPPAGAPTSSSAARPTSAA
ncbi:hypothetical protein ACQEVZ_02435 [Dactylosporangium sp. CA-152071]|uniref:hypothetical protein n=1 Tax=Dactylosporangium sp. CA-152071 TaxID=3239933 RepID=UPI003D930BA7